MYWELSTGYKLWLTRIEKNKKLTLLLAKPNSNEFIKIGLIDNILGIQLLREAFNVTKSEVNQ